jgi:MinD superfamily P-loop ATPase
VPDKKAGLSSFPPVEPPPVFYRVRCNCGCTTEEHELRVDERWNLVPTRCMSCGACEQFTLSEEG